MFTVSEAQALKIIPRQKWLTGIFTKYDNDQYGFVRMEWGGNIVNTGPTSLAEAQRTADVMTSKFDYHVLTKDPLDTVEELQDFFSNQKNELDEQIRIQKDVLKGLTHLLTLHGINTWNTTGDWRLIEVNRINKRWTWTLINPSVAKQEDHLNKVTFEQPFYRNMTMNFQPAIERQRKNESAALFLINNQSDTPITRVISKEIQTVTNVRNNIQVGINWNISAGIQAGVSGTDSNFGATVLASFGMSLGGDYRKEEETSKTNQATQRVEENLTFSPGGIYEVELTNNKVSYTRPYTCSGISDWKVITLTTCDVKVNDAPSIQRSATEVERDGWTELMAKICGARNIQNSFYLQEPTVRQQRTVARSDIALKDVALLALEEGTRILEFKGSVDYDEASELSLRVLKNERV